MRQTSICCIGNSSAIRYAQQHLAASGISVTEDPEQEYQHLLLDVPSFLTGSSISKITPYLKQNITLWGGNVYHSVSADHRTIDLLQDEQYLAENAAITAHCALEIALPLLNVTLDRCPILILGWGRIGKCLARLLRNMGADVTVAARSPRDRAVLHSLGYQTTDFPEINSLLPDTRLIYNTVPEPVSNLKMAALCPRAVKIDLASQKSMAGADVIHARGLPGKLAPESSGNLIAETVLRKMKEEQL